MAAIDLETESIASLAVKMASGEISALSLTQHCLDRIAELDAKLGSVIELNPDSLGIAGKLDDERRAGKVRGPLHGLPILIKDNNGLSLYAGEHAWIINDPEVNFAKEAGTRTWPLEVANLKSSTMGSSDI